MLTHTHTHTHTHTRKSRCCCLVGMSLDAIHHHHYWHLHSLLHISAAAAWCCWLAILSSADQADTDGSSLNSSPALPLLPFPPLNKASPFCSLFFPILYLPRSLSHFLHFFHSSISAEPQTTQPPPASPLEGDRWSVGRETQTSAHRSPGHQANALACLLAPHARCPRLSFLSLKLS